MKVSDVMTTRVISVGPETAVGDAVRLMAANGISGLPVIDPAGALVGIVSEGDLLRRAELGTGRKHPWWMQLLLGAGPLAGEYVQAHGRKVASVMSRDVVTVAEEAALDDVVRLMEKHRIKRLPVVRGGKVVGIVSRANLLRALARLAPSAAPSATGDAAIRTALLAALEGEPWGRRGLINPIVRDGEVELWGTIFDEREREAARVLAENVPGVKSVRDSLIWMDPFSGFAIQPDPAGPASGGAAPDTKPSKKRDAAA